MPISRPIAGTRGPLLAGWVPPKKKKTKKQAPGAAYPIFPVAAPAVPQMTGGNPFQTLINARPDFSGLESGYRAQGAADRAGAIAALRRYMASYGAIPDLGSLNLSGDSRSLLGEAMDDQTRALAAKADAEGLSIKARLERDNTQKNRDIRNQLAARGMLESGDTGHYLSEQAQNYKVQGYDVLNELLGNIEGTVSGYMNAERERQLALEMAKMQAAMDAYGDWGDYDIYEDAPAAAPGAPAAAARPPARKRPKYTYAGTVMKKGKPRPYARRGGI